MTIHLKPIQKFKKNSSKYALSHACLKEFIFLSNFIVAIDIFVI